ncbi:MAG TPA: hydroxymethylglutaryl-CoA synthase [Nevskiaceae bacterium]|nr:hydroxymethylglutaryl-CoA synthase [Nevskiaceae bacterium]
MAGKSKVGVVGFGAYIPRARIDIGKIAHFWGQDGRVVKESLLVEEKAVCSFSEDSVTMAVEASKITLLRSGVDKGKIGAVFMGSESHPYAVNPSSTKVASLLGLDGDLFASDLEFACKAGTAAIQIVASLILSGKTDYGLAIGADRAQAKPGDALEYTTASAAASFVLGKFPREFLAEIIDFCSVASDTPDFWRRQEAKYPSHGGRFTGKHAYFEHTMRATKRLFKKTGTKPADFDHVVFHMPNGKFPRSVGQALGFNPSQLKLGLAATQIGNSYSACSLLGLCFVLEKAKAGEKILLVSYGSGAGSDAFYLKTYPTLLKKRRVGKRLKNFLEDRREIDYLEYLKMMGEVGRFE